MIVRVRTICPWRALAPAVLLAALACGRPSPHAARRPPPPPPAPATDAPVARGDRTLCAARSAPPEDLSVGPDRGPPVVAWNGSQFGVAWTERRDGEQVVMFVRVREDG